MSEFSVITNPIFQNAAQSAFFESVNVEDPGAQQRNASVYANNQNVLDVTQEELAGMKKWASILRIIMLIVSTLMIVTAYYNIGVVNTTSTGSTNSSATFLAVYVFFFSTLICCYEVALKFVSVYIVQNFGFMYNPWGRFIFLILVAIMLFQLSTMGQVIFAFLVLAMCVHIFVDLRYRQFEKFIRLTHLHINIVLAAPGGATTQV